jgi:WD40 repeat protein
MDVAQRELNRGHVAKVIERLERHLPALDEEDLRGFEWYYLWSACEGAIMSPTFELGAGVADVRYSRDGQTLITASLGRGRITQRDARTLQVIRSVDFENEGVSQYEFGRLSPDDKVFATSLANGDIRLVDVVTGEESLLSGHAEPAWMPGFSPDGQLLASGDEAGRVILWDMSTRQQIHEFNARPDGHAHDLEVVQVSFSSDGTMLATASRDETAKIWNVATGALLNTIDSGPHTRTIRSSIWSIAFSPDGKQLATGTAGAYLVLLWDVETGELIKKLAGHDVKPSRLAFSPDGTILASAGGKIWLWDVTSDSEKALDSFPTTTVNHVPFLLFSSDGSTLVAAHDGGVKLLQLDCRANPTVRRLPDDCQLTNPGSLVAVSADAATIVFASTTGRIEVWDMLNRDKTHTFFHGAELRSLAWLDGKRQVVSLCVNGSIKLWNADTCELINTIASDSQDVEYYDVCVDSRGAMFAASFDGGVHRWDLNQANPQRETVHPPWSQRILNRLALSADGNRTASFIKDETNRFVDIWDVANNQRLQTISLGKLRPSFGVFSNNGSYFAANNEQPNDAIVWTSSAAKNGIVSLGTSKRSPRSVFHPTEIESSPEVTGVSGCGTVVRMSSNLNSKPIAASSTESLCRPTLER